MISSTDGLTVVRPLFSLFLPKVLLWRRVLRRIADSVEAHSRPMEKRGGKNKTFLWRYKLHSTRILDVDCLRSCRYVAKVMLEADSLLLSLFTTASLTVKQRQWNASAVVPNVLLSQAPKVSSVKAKIRVDFIFADVMKQQGWVAEATLLFVHTNLSAKNLIELRNKAGRMKVTEHFSST